MSRAFIYIFACMCASGGRRTCSVGGTGLGACLRALLLQWCTNTRWLSCWWAVYEAIYL